MPFALVASFELWLARTSTTPWSTALLAWAGVATGWVAMAYLLGRPGMLLKARGGLWVLAPFTLFAAGIARAARRLGVTESSQVAPGLWVGGWPLRRTPIDAQFDCTAELPRRGRSTLYACEPMLDGVPVPGAKLRAAIAQVREWRSAGRSVLLHCAYGHGRSVAVACAVMVLDGDAVDAPDALRRIRELRPGARLDPGQRAAIEDAIRGLRQAPP